MRKKVIIITVIVVGFFGVVSLTKHLILGGAPDATPAANSIPQSATKALNPSPSADTPGVKPPIEGKDFTVKSTKYFDGDRWAVVYITPVKRDAGDPAYIIMRKSQASYQTVMGPGTLFPIDELNQAGLPQDAMDYLDSLGLVASF